MAIQEAYKIVMEMLETTMAYLEANLEYMDCRGDMDCDHCSITG